MEGEFYGGMEGDYNGEYQMQMEMIQQAQSDALEREKNMMEQAMTQRNQQVKYVQQHEKEALKQRGQMLKKPTGQGKLNPRQAQMAMVQRAAHARQQQYQQRLHQYQNQVMQHQRNYMEQQYNMMQDMMNNGGGMF